MAKWTCFCGWSVEKNCGKQTNSALVIAKLNHERKHMREEQLHYNESVSGMSK